MNQKHAAGLVTYLLFFSAFGALLLQAAQRPPLVFHVSTTDGKKQTGGIQELTSDGRLRLANASLPLQPANWLTLRRDNVPLPPHPRGPQIVFANGDRVCLAGKSAVKLMDNRLRFEPKPPLVVNGGTLQVPLPALALIWLGGPENADDPALLLRQLATGSHGNDLVMLRNGDRVQGRLTALDSALGCQLDVGKRIVQLAWANIGAVALSSDLRSSAAPNGRHYRLIMEDGGRITLASVRYKNTGKSLSGQTVFDNAVETPLSSVVAVEVYGGAATYLSDIKPVKYEHIPFAGPSWPLVPGGSVSGHELRLAGSTYDKGLGTHAECRISYDLSEKYSWFEARVGLDPEFGQRGRVKLRILVDGKERDLGWNKELTIRDEPLNFRVDVRKGRELTLEVLCAGFGDVQAHVNWADARLID